MLSVLLFITSLIGILSDWTAYDVPTSANQRDTRRRQDFARILSAFSDYQANNNGKMPGTQHDIDLFVTRYIGGSNSDTTSCSSDQFCDPDGKPYHLNGPTAISSDVDSALAGKSFATDNHTIHYYQSAMCGDKKGSLIYKPSNREISIMYILEDGSIYCADNQ